MALELVDFLKDNIYISVLHLHKMLDYKIVTITSLLYLTIKTVRTQGQLKK